jgi:hypothetical protein
MIATQNLFEARTNGYWTCRIPGLAVTTRGAVLADGTILCLYECDIVTGMADDRYLRLTRFDLEWLTRP